MNSRDRGSVSFLGAEHPSQKKKLTVLKIIVGYTSPKRLKVYVLSY